MKRFFIILTLILAATPVLAQDYIAVEELMNGDSRTLYEILGVKKKSDGSNLKSKYKRYLKKHHPSKAEADPASLKELAKVSLAYHVLHNPSLREIYDNQGLDGLNEKIRVPNLLPPLYDGDDFFYRYKLRNACNKNANRNIPLAEKKARHSGMAVLSYMLGTDNSVSDIKVEESSGYPVLDTIAVNSLIAVANKNAKHITPAYSLVSGNPSESRQLIYVSLFRYGPRDIRYSRDAGQRDYRRYPLGYRNDDMNSVKSGNMYTIPYGQYGSWGLYSPVYNGYSGK
jgi:curved DNA-binding protein CbpA